MRKKKTKIKKEISLAPQFFIWPFEVKDWIIFVIATLASWIIYFYTAAPNVTLLDSGELITAAIRFGVPHPTGYPLWTLGAWLFSRLPLPLNEAWLVNAFSGFCGGLAVGLIALLIHHSINWLIHLDKPNEIKKRQIIAAVFSLSFSLTFAMSVPMWTQCVIAEVYALHVLLVMFFICALYRWLRTPDENVPFIVMMFFYALAWSNHHLILSLTPVPLILLVLLRKKHVWEMIVYLTIIGAIGYIIFAQLSNDPKTPMIEDQASINASWRFLLCTIMLLGILFWKKRKLPNWKAGVMLLVVIAVGFAPYLYMPFASSTNPPMNWAYAKERSGFYWSINRSQYHGSLSSQFMNTIGKAVGSAPPPSPSQPIFKEKSSIDSLRDFSALYWSKITESFSWAALVCFLFAFCIILFLDFLKRAWILSLFTMFILAAFLEPFFNKPNTDLQAWLVQMPYHTYSFALFAIVAAIGAAYATWYFFKFRKLSPRWSLVWFLLPLGMAVQNAPLCSQREHWFGWNFGRDMLCDLPKNSIVFGGTDPGRFVPTYMIFGESSQKPNVKKDPQFDRRDLYIITQNTLLDPFYLKYLHDQYTEKRPPVKNKFEKWLGRENIYPQEPILLPTYEEVTQITRETLLKPCIEAEMNPGYNTLRCNMAVAEWVFQKNKDKHDFFIEESFQMPWTYDYAIPHGLCYQLSKEPLSSIPEEAVKKDMQFWEEYTRNLLSNPRFKDDIDAQRSFAKLRAATGNIYKHRGMLKEAEIAWRQAFEMWPPEEQTLDSLIKLLVRQKRFDEAVACGERAYQMDPYNMPLARLAFGAMQYKEIYEKIQKLKMDFDSDPQNKKAVLEIIQSYGFLEDFDSGEEIIRLAIEKSPQDEDIYAAAINYYMFGNKHDQALELANKIKTLKPNDGKIRFMISKLYFFSGKRDEFYKMAHEAVQVGGIPVRELFALDTQLRSVRNEPEFQKLISPTNSSINEETTKTGNDRLQNSSPQQSPQRSPQAAHAGQ